MLQPKRWWCFFPWASSSSFLTSFFSWCSCKTKPPAPTVAAAAISSSTLCLWACSGSFLASCFSCCHKINHCSKKGSILFSIHIRIYISIFCYISFFLSFFYFICLPIFFFISHYILHHLITFSLSFFFLKFHLFLHLIFYELLLFLFWWRHKSTILYTPMTPTIFI